MFLNTWQTGPVQTRYHRTPARTAGCEPHALPASDRQRPPRRVLVGRALGLPLAGSVIYATAQARGADVWTHDEHFRGLPGVPVVEPST
jgi:hypothetical protein